MQTLFLSVYMALNVNKMTFRHDFCSRWPKTIENE